MNETAPGPRVLSMSLGMEAHSDPRKVDDRQRGRFSKDVNRLMSAAAVSTRFRRQLLSDPASALAAGYNGERFPLTPDEVRIICSIHANSLRNFAAQLVELVQEPVSELRKAWTPPATETYSQPAYEPVRVPIRTQQRQ